MPVKKPAALLQNRVEAVRDYHAECGVERAELDLSGGIDSAVLAGVLVLALGPENVTLAHLGINSNPIQTDRAVRLAKGLNCRLVVGDFTDMYEGLVAYAVAGLAKAGYDEQEIAGRMAADPTILGSIRSTLRAPLGRAFNRLTGGGIRHGTGNECEDRFLRFYQKGGDGEVDTNPIAMLSKAETYQLAYELAHAFGQEALTAYYDTITALPSADLWGVGDKHNDESELNNWLGASFTYGRLNCSDGKVVKIGTIERVARFLDERIQNPSGGQQNGGPTWQESSLFNDETQLGFVSQTVIDAAIKSWSFKDSGLSEADILALLRGARKAERLTRHKMNPNCPQLGSRKELVDAGILSDNFNDYGINPALTQQQAV